MPGQPLVIHSPAPNPAGFAFHGAMQQGGMVIGVAPAGTATLGYDGSPVPMDAQRRFLIAFGRDHGPSATLEAVRADGTVVTYSMTIAPSTYRIEALPIPKYQQPEAEFLKIREGELAQIKAAREQAAIVQGDGWRQSFIWPVNGRISGAFGAQRVYNGEKGSYHSGEDVAVPTGTPVRAPADGVVILAATGDPFTLEGHLLMVAHGMGLDSAFLHLSHIDVKVGDVVKQGQVIGESGMTGRATGPHLHWALTWRGERIDPKLVAGAMAAPADRLSRSDAP
ncbi:M23 family metallopeptidase [Sphingomonas sp. CGMCC 1.13654]|uniref:M23 family metallopeptidase n=2 Tax=Sphingomonas chungangi TaxID=2683589 RepID=A0A838L0X8_9SPHN|nr:M23 family metallopeptidase [Sphingomonas chungangi]MBA2932707.1 M23 family metallopeptidase [Sphingomonas chungangi]MVW56329.1 peptidoglycan DD-metalloendopeptidase family protein [Sphingomonas chungangi]